MKAQDYSAKDETRIGERSAKVFFFLAKNGHFHMKEFRSTVWYIGWGWSDWDWTWASDPSWNAWPAGPGHGTRIQNARCQAHLPLLVQYLQGKNTSKLARSLPKASNFWADLQKMPGMGGTKGPTAPAVPMRGTGTVVAMILAESDSRCDRWESLEYFLHFSSIIFWRWS